MNRWILVVSFGQKAVSYDVEDERGSAFLTADYLSQGYLSCYLEARVSEKLTVFAPHLIAITPPKVKKVAKANPAS